MTIEKKRSPIIALPDDVNRREQLKAKLKEYGGRLNPYGHPASQMSKICKKTVLERLLQDGKVNTLKLSLEMEKIYGSYFSVDDFNNACGVIQDYCETGGANVSGGTGLPRDGRIPGRF